MTATQIAHGDFSELAEDYSKFRPGYSESALNAILGLIGKPVSDIDFADVGAGTGIWTRLVARRGCRSAVAVEPNAAMRQRGEQDSIGTAIRWQMGSGEATGLAGSSFDLLSMASSFHWVDFDRATREFHRVLRPRGYFVALWNPRYIDDNPLLVEIEAELKRLKPDLKRVSSGRSGVTETLTARLISSPCFDDVIQIEARHTADLSIDQYIGAWRSVNDLRVQLGEALFSQFLEFVERKVAGLPKISATYLTRAWCARRAPD